jgi:hypothetical protein
MGSVLRVAFAPPGVEVILNPSELDELFAEVLLGGKGIVCVAAPRENCPPCAPARVLGRH